MFWFFESFFSRLNLIIWPAMHRRIADQSKNKKDFTCHWTLRLYWMVEIIKLMPTCQATTKYCGAIIFSMAHWFFGDVFSICAGRPGPKERKLTVVTFFLHNNDHLYILMILPSIKEQPTLLCHNFFECLICGLSIHVFGPFRLSVKHEMNRSLNLGTWRTGMKLHKQ